MTPEIVKAGTLEGALQQSRYKFGQQVAICGVEAQAILPVGTWVIHYRLCKPHEQDSVEKESSQQERMEQQVLHQGLPVGGTGDEHAGDC